MTKLSTNSSLLNYSLEQTISGQNIILENSINFGNHYKYTAKYKLILQMS